jgi:Alr-MurF fusion protein
MLAQRFTVSEIAAIIKAEVKPSGYRETPIHDLIIDSRLMFKAGNTIFFALKSKRNDGHKYIGELYNRGLRNFIISKEIEIEKYPEANFLIVKDTLTALQELAAAYRQKFDIPVIGITGSNGKTIIKEWLFQLLSPDKKVVRSPKSYNSQIGVPLSVWQMDKDYEMAIFEAGISEPEEMNRLQKIIKPNIGIFSNIGEAHSENFINRLQKVGEKLKLFTKVQTLIYCIDHAEIQEVIIRSEILDTIRAFAWSRKQPADLRIVKTEFLENNQSIITGIYNNVETSITIPFIDKASLENAIHCWALMLLLGYDNQTINQRMMALTPIAMRLELIEGINNCTVINDSYNSDINSLTIALDFLNQHSRQNDKTLILSDILQSGKSDIYLYGKIAEMLKSKNIKRLIGIGPAISKQAEHFDMEKDFYPSTGEFLKAFSFSKFQNEGILLKGARIFEFEQISQALQQKAHETVLEINLSALIQNFNYFKSKLLPQTKVMAMVKAGSYGMGSFEVANALEFHKADYLAVAYADEGVELRKAGIKTPIMVMNPDEESFDSIIAYNLEPEIYNRRVLGLLEKAIRRNIIPRNKPVKIHLKIDTGMHRLGFDEHELPPIIQLIEGNSRIYIQSIFTHLASSDFPDHRDFTLQQIDAFSSIAENISKNISYMPLRHVLNSAGIIAYNHAQFDMVRLGIGLFGVSPFEKDQKKLQTVSTLKSTVSQIKFIKSGETIGYGRAGKAHNDMMLATVPIGYADGLSRSLSNGAGNLMIKGTIVPIVGKVCMDMTMIDVTGMNIKEGDEVEVFGKNRSISHLANEMKTIPYEILTGISKRVKRVYFQD